MDEGYIKFSCHLENSEPPDLEAFPGLSRLRTDLHDAGLIGVYPDGTGFGNVSALIRRGPAFIISGSATGSQRELSPACWSVVEYCSIAYNSLRCRGLVPASSESLTHDAVYRANPAVCYVVHVHSWPLFRSQLEGGAAATPPGAAFGTADIAQAVYDQVAGREGTGGVLVMAGHEEGVIVYGSRIHDIRRILKNCLRSSRSPLALDCIVQYPRANRWQLTARDRVPHHDRKKGTSPLNMVSARVQENSPLPG